jgi:hypothetical protein
MRAYCDSSYCGSLKPIEQVRIFPAPISRIIATTALESMPPERNAPSGTSETRRLRTASRSRSRSSASHVSGEPSGRRSPASGTSQ